jgi:hypothetical protein
MHSPCSPKDTCTTPRRSAADIVLEDLHDHERSYAQDSSTTVQLHGKGWRDAACSTFISSSQISFSCQACPNRWGPLHILSHAGNIGPCQGAYHELLASMLHALCRAKMMGFNAARIEWSVDGLATAPKEFTTADCDIATTADIQASMLPPTTADTPQPTGTPTLPQQPPTTGTTGDVCSSDLPNTSTQDRYVYLVHYLCGQVRPHTACISCHSKLPAILVQSHLTDRLEGN